MLCESREVDFHPPFISIGIVGNDRNSRRGYIRRLVRTVSQPDTNVDHVKYDGDDGRDLSVGIKCQCDNKY